MKRQLFARESTIEHTPSCGELGNGVVTGASLMADGPDAEAAVEQARPAAGGSRDRRFQPIAEPAPAPS
jgi:hypothetical protein